MIRQYDTNEEEKSTTMANEPAATWGGKWTERKLVAFEKYVHAYLTIMNKYRDQYNWKLLYFDGFAGSGTRTATQDELTTYKGAAERILSITDRGFDYYYFIDKDPASIAKLESRLSTIINPGKREFRASDANAQVRDMALALQNKKLKALVLLDPFGMQVSWETLTRLKGTGTDLWILVPTGVIVNRLLDRKGQLTHIERLTSFFGKDEAFLRNYFYKTNTEQTLFGENEVVRKVEQPIQKIAELYTLQLKEIFKYVSPNPLVLRNSCNTPIFHFVFASNNKAAMNIANDIISD